MKFKTMILTLLMLLALALPLTGCVKQDSGNTTEAAQNAESPEDIQNSSLPASAEDLP